MLLFCFDTQSRSMQHAQILNRNSGSHLKRLLPATLALTFIMRGLINGCSSSEHSTHPPPRPISVQKWEYKF